MSEMWSTFARTGHPDAKWPAYTIEKRATMEIDVECIVVDDPFGLERKVWERLDHNRADGGAYSHMRIWICTTSRLGYSARLFP